MVEVWSIPSGRSSIKTHPTAQLKKTFLNRMNRLKENKFEHNENEQIWTLRRISSDGPIRTLRTADFDDEEWQNGEWQNIMTIFINPPKLRKQIMISFQNFGANIEISFTSEYSNFLRFCKRLQYKYSMKQPSRGEHSIKTDLKRFPFQQLSLSNLGNERKLIIKPWQMLKT